MLEKPYLFLLLILLPLLYCCDSNANSKKDRDDDDANGEKIRQASDTNEIISLIVLYEYVKREQNREIYSTKKLEQLKESINYDSILINRDLTVFDNN